MFQMATHPTKPKVNNNNNNDNDNDNDNNNNNNDNNNDNNNNNKHPGFLDIWNCTVFSKKNGPFHISPMHPKNLGTLWR